MGKREELDRLAKKAWPTVNGIEVEDGFNCAEIGNGSTLCMLVEIDHARASEAMLAALRVLAGESPAQPILDRLKALEASLRDGVGWQGDHHYAEGVEMAADKLAAFIAEIGGGK